MSSLASSSSQRSLNLEPVFVSSSCPLNEFDLKNSIEIGKSREGLNSAVIYDLYGIITTVFPKSKQNEFESFNEDSDIHEADSDDDDVAAPSVRLVTKFLKDIGMEFNFK